MTIKISNIKSSLLIATMLLGMQACKETKKAEEAKEENLPENIVEMRADQIKMAQIETGKIEQRSISGSIKVNGKIAVSPQNLATVCMPMGGFIKSTRLMPGNAVQKGQVLAVIENQDFIELQQNYLEVKNKLEYAQAEYQRHKELYKDEVYSQKNVQQVTTDYKNLKAQLHGLEQKLALIGIQPSRLNEDNISRSVNLVAPISGYIKAVNVSIGKSVSASDVLFEIVNSSDLFLELTLYEKDADKVSNGQQIRFFINNESEEHLAQIYQTGKSINEDKTYKVYARVKSSCKNILPGMYVNAMIQANNNCTNTLPEEAVVSFDDKDYIFVVDKQKTEKGQPFTEYKMIRVKKGVSDGRFVEVTLPSDLSASGLQVVVKGAYNLMAAKKNAGDMAC